MSISAMDFEIIWIIENQLFWNFGDFLQVYMNIILTILESLYW